MKTPQSKISNALKISLLAYTIICVLASFYFQLKISTGIMIFLAGIGIITLLDGPLIKPLRAWVLNKEIDFYETKAKLLQEAIDHAVDVLHKHAYSVNDKGIASKINTKFEKSINYNQHQVYAFDKNHAQKLFKTHIEPKLKKEDSKKFFYVNADTHNLK